MSEDDSRNLRLHEAETPLWPSHLRQPPTWFEFMREIDAQWQHYMREHDSPEERLTSKVRTRFTLTG